MQADDFIRKGSAGSPAHALGERAGAQAHFIDLCRWLGVPEPGDPDSYCFERGLTKTGSAGGRTDGFADVWKRGWLAWEYTAPVMCRASAKLSRFMATPEVAKHRGVNGLPGAVIADKNLVVIARPGFAGELAKRTLTNLYDQRPAWLAQAHAALDAAVAAAYGWTDWRADLSDEEILRRLLALNRGRAGE